MNAIDVSNIILRWPDYLVIGAVLIISGSIGVYYRFSGGRQKTAEEYFTANRSMSVPLLATALMVAYLSAITLLGTSGESYIYGAHIIVITVGYIIGTPIAAFLYLPVFYNLQNMSVYEYLNRRFGGFARLAASLANFFQMGLYTGIVLYAPALALEATTGLSSTASILLIGIICTFYSSIGGIKAVLATDVFQGFLMFTSVICIIVIAVHDLEDGFSTVWKVAGEGGRLDIFNFDLDPTVRHTWWSLSIGGTSYFVAHVGVNQIYVQRLLSAKSLKSAQTALYVNVPLMILMFSSAMISGLVLYAWFAGCDPVVTGKIASFDQVMPFFAKVRLSEFPGLLGFFIAGIFSAALSTVSAMLNSLSAVAIADYAQPICRRFEWELSDSRTALLGKLFCIVNGLLCVAVAFVASGLGSLMQTTLAINGTIAGPILGLFSLGLFAEVANERGAVAGTVISLALSAWMSFGQPKPPTNQLPVSVTGCSANSSYYLESELYHRHLGLRNVDQSDYFYYYRLSYMWYTPFGWITTMLFGYAASILVRCFCEESRVEPDPDLFTPIVAARIIRRRGTTVKGRKESPAFVSSCLQER